MTTNSLSSLCGGVPENEAREKEHHYVRLSCRGLCVAHHVVGYCSPLLLQWWMLIHSDAIAWHRLTRHTITFCMCTKYSGDSYEIRNCKTSHAIFSSLIAPYSHKLVYTLSLVCIHLLASPVLWFIWYYSCAVKAHWNWSDLFCRQVFFIQCEHLIASFTYEVPVKAWYLFV